MELDAALLDVEGVPKHRERADEEATEWENVKPIQKYIQGEEWVKTFMEILRKKSLFNVTWL